MVLMFFTEVAFETGWWAIKQTYNLGHYMFYGTQETKEDRMLRQIEELRKEIEAEKKALETMKVDECMYYKQLVEENKMERMDISQNMYNSLNSDE